MKKMFLLIVAMIFAVTSVNSPAVAGEGCGGSGTKGAIVGGAVGGLLGHSLGARTSWPAPCWARWAVRSSVR